MLKKHILIELATLDKDKVYWFSTTSAYSYTAYEGLNWYNFDSVLGKSMLRYTEYISSIYEEITREELEKRLFIYELSI